MDSVQKANAGHPGTAMALAPLAYLLYRKVLRHNPANPDWPNRDRFVLSAGHACILQYAALHLSGYNLSLEELKRFRQWESRTPGHPEHFLTEGVETTTGPLGQGFANGVGFAIADRFLAERYNRPHHDDRRPARLRDLLRRRPDGGRHDGGRVDRRPPRPRPARLLLRRQPHHDRRHDRAQLHDRGQGQALRGARLARAVGRRLRGPRRARAGDPRRAGRGGAPVADHRPQPHRVRRAERDRHLQVARRAARRGRGPRRQGGARARSGQAVRRAGRGLRAHGRAARPGSRPSRSGTTASSGGRRRSRSCARTGRPTAPASRGPAGSRRCRRSRPARTSPRATPARR